MPIRNYNQPIEDVVKKLKDPSQLNCTIVSKAWVKNNYKNIANFALFLEETYGVKTEHKPGKYDDQRAYFVIKLRKGSGSSTTRSRKATESELKAYKRNLKTLRYEPSPRHHDSDDGERTRVRKIHTYTPEGLMQRRHEVLAVDTEGNVVKEFRCVEDLMAEYGYHGRDTVYKCINRHKFSRKAKLYFVYKHNFHGSNT